MDKIECYIEEYINDNFKLCARLRDKKTNKHVILEINNIMDKNKFLNFLSQAKIQLETQEIKKMNRTKVHLSDNLEKAKNVGSRHGKVIVLVIDSKKMIQDGFQISLSKDEVYLSENIPIKYILKTI